jgi:uncharacterized membrane-anchored protein
MNSEHYTLESPTSFAGSARRIWLIDRATWYKWLAVVILIPLAWSFVLCWYLFFGIWLIPYRLIRRSQRKRKLEDMRHRELLNNGGGRNL